MEDEQVLGINSFLLILFVTISILLGLLLKKKKWSYFLPESGAAMIFGFIIGLFASLAGEEEANRLVFSSDVFFFILLPPIIFEAGYTLEKKPFFRNLGSIMTYAVFGTLISAMLFGLIMWGFARAGAFPLDTANPLECLLFGALISATDPVATLAILGAPELKADPLLYALVFGESVLNDAVGVVLYNTFSGFVDSEFTAGTLFQGIGVFFGVALGSTVVGVFVAAVGCYTIKSIDLTDYPHYEFTLITLFAFASYFFAEMCTLSGIMSLFFGAITLSHYNTSNVTEMTQHTTHQAYKTIAQICETFVFIYIGVTAGLGVSPLVFRLEWSFGCIVCTIFCILLGRVFNIFPLTWILNRYRHLKIPMRMQFPMWFSGLRGAVAFALSLRVPTENASVIVSTTLVTVMFTTLVMGGMTLPVLRKFGMTNSDMMGDWEKEEARAQAAAEASAGAPAASRREEHAIDRFTQRFTNGFERLDQKYFSPWFTGKWKGGRAPSGHGHSHGGNETELVGEHPNAAPAVHGDHEHGGAVEAAVHDDQPAPIEDDVHAAGAAADADVSAPVEHEAEHHPAALHTESAPIESMPAIPTDSPSRATAANPFKQDNTL